MKKEFYLSDFADKKSILKDGIFENLGSAKTQNKNNVLCYAVNVEYFNIAKNNPNISAIIIPSSLKVETDKAIIIDDEPDILYGNILNYFIKNGLLYPKMEYYQDQSASIDPSAFISKKTYIGANVQIGRNVIINDYTIIEDDCIIGDNVVLGCDGFYFKRDKSGKFVKFLHAGGVHLEKNVEIMINSIVQRAHDAEFTIIGEGSKVSVNSNISHSAIIGKHNMITGNVQIAGRVKMGDYCWIGNSVTISDSVEIGNNVKIRVGSVVVNNVLDDGDVSGNFAYNHTKNIKNFIKDQRS